MNLNIMIIGSILLSAVLAYNSTNKTLVELNQNILSSYNETTLSQVEELKEGIKNYCVDNNISATGRPTLSDLETNNYYYGGNIMDKTTSLDWSVSNPDWNKVQINFNLKNSRNSLRVMNMFLNSMKWKKFGNEKDCEKDSGNINYGDCYINIPLGIKCE